MLTEQEKHILIHCLTGSNRDRKVYRNRFAADDNHSDINAIKELIAMGLMSAGSKIGDTQEDIDANYRYYRCTEYGAAAVGLRLPEDK
jgi:surface antigen